MPFLSAKQTLARRLLLSWPCCLGLALVAAFLCAQISAPVSAQVPQNRSASDVLAPVRIGDKVEVRGHTGGWIPATVVTVEAGMAEVETVRAGQKNLQKYSFNKIRFPNGEGQWATWKTRNGKLNVAARYIARDENEVMIRTADGEELMIPINDLALNLKQRVKASPITGQENAVNGVVPIKVGENVQVQRYSDWYDGVIQSIDIGEAVVKYTRSGHQYTDSFAFANVRYPNGGWKWEKWSNADGTTTFEGRFIGRDATTATIKRNDGTEFRMPIEELDSRLKRRVMSVREIGKVNHINGADPFRPGDNIQVIIRDLWYEGVVTEMLIGKARVEYKSSGEMKTEEFTFDQIRFPNGEGRWREWKSANGKFKIIGRYISRTKTHVTIRKLSGSDVTVPNESLSTSLRRILAKSPITGAETLIGGVNPIRVGDQVEVRTGRSSSYYYHHSSTQSAWQPGLIVESHPGHALVELEGKKAETKIFKFIDIRYPNGEGPWQKWETANKEFEVVARYIRRSAKSVTLVKEDGKLIDVPIESLSLKLKKTVKAIPIISKIPTETEFEPARNVVAFLDQNQYQDFKEFSISAAPANPTKAIKGGVGISLEFGNNVSGVTPLIAPASTLDFDKPWYALGTYASPGFQGPRWTKLFWVCPSDEDFKEGPNFQPEERVVDYSATQQRLINLVLSENHSTEIGFRTYKVKPLNWEAVPEYSWSVPKAPKSYSGSSKTANFKVELVGENQVLLSSSNSVALHDFEQRKVIYTIPDVSHGHFVLHPSKRFFAVVRGERVALIDVQTGKQLAVEETPAAGVGFSLDGKKLVVIDSRIRIWDLESNSEPSVHERRNLLQSSSGPVVMIDDKWIKAGNQLYSLTKEIVVWSYAASGVNMKHNEMLGEMNLLAASKSTSVRKDGRRFTKTLALVGLAKVPHAPAVDALNKLEKLDMLMLKPGSSVRIEVEGDSRIRDSILEAIKKSGWNEDPEAEVVIKAYAKEEQTKRVEYNTYTTRSRFGLSHHFRTPDSIVSVTVTPWTQGVEILSGDQVAWKQVRTAGVPHNLRSTNGQSFQSLANEATQPNYRLFENLELPKEIIAPEYRNGLGRTDITVRGFVDRLYADFPEEEIEDGQEDVVKEGT